MSVHYNIATWSSGISPEASSYRQVKRLDAALEETWRQIYAMCKADAALDTARAQRLMAEFTAFDADCIANHPLKSLHYRSHKFILRDGSAGAGEHVTFTAVRER